MKVKATRKGFDNTKIRKEGEVFEMDVKKCPSWCEQVKEKKAPVKEKVEKKDEKKEE